MRSSRKWKWLKSQDTQRFLIVVAACLVVALLFVFVTTLFVNKEPASTYYPHDDARQERLEQEQ